jgi:hypothetical protein
MAGLYIQAVTLTISLRCSAGLKDDRRRLDRAALAVYLVNRNRAEILNEQIRIDPVRPSLRLAARHSQKTPCCCSSSLSP